MIRRFALAAALAVGALGVVVPGVAQASTAAPSFYYCGATPSMCGYYYYTSGGVLAGYIVKECDGYIYSAGTEHSPGGYSTWVDVPCPTSPPVVGE